MKKNVALIATMDSKEREIQYAAELLRQKGCVPFIIDISLGSPYKGTADIYSEEILLNNDIPWEQFTQGGRNERFIKMRDSLSRYMPELYKKGVFAAILSIGGGQNGLLAAAAMQALPFGVPKIIVSALACGTRIFDIYMGYKDIMVMYSVADVYKLNSVSKTVINNACNAIAGMSEGLNIYERDKSKRSVAVTMMGITSYGAEHAMDILETHGYETYSFHSNGTGGRSMEHFIEKGLFDIILDMSLHEITCEIFGGYCVGANNRLIAAIDKELPMVVVPGALDMIDFFYNDNAGIHLPDNISQRKYVHHNSNNIHAKVFPHEAERLAAVVSERLNKTKASITFMLPLGGFCEHARKGGGMCDPETDQVFIEYFRRHLSNPLIKTMEVDANICDPVFYEATAEEVMKLDSMATTIAH